MILGLERKKEERKKCYPNVEDRTLTVRAPHTANVALITVLCTYETLPGLKLMDCAVYSRIQLQSRATTACPE